MLDSVQNLMSALSGENINQLSNMTGLERDKVQSAVGQILPALMKGLSDNTKDPKEAEELANALDRDHNGSILNNVSSAFMNGDKPEDTGQDTNGLGILQHIFHGKQADVANQIGNNLNLDQGQIMALMAKLAPVVMGFLGKTKKDNNMNGTDLGSLLTTVTSMMGQSSGGQGGNDMMGSLMQMGGQLLGGQKGNKKSGGGLKEIGGSLLKGFLNKKK